MTENDFIFWKEACKNVYKLELEILSRSCASRIAKFISLYVFKRKKDELNENACLLIDKLRDIL